jgi:formate hydrogenlyase subunit 3/multisubunit Na+/H+ antiporter MnhD subunit
MIYQGIIDFGQGTGISNQLWMVWLGLAVLGSALTLASFIKFTGVFSWDVSLKRYQDQRGGAVMWIPMLVLALICIGFGVFSTQLVIPKLFMPVTGTFEFTGTWPLAP